MFSRCNWLYLISKEIWVLSVCVGGCDLPGNRQVALGSQVGAVRADSAETLGSPLSYSLSSWPDAARAFPARRAGQSGGEELPTCLCCWS